ncbi:MAG: phage holin family protein [Dehalococcoidia bacterium]|jgi:putative membrane protein
MIIVRYWGETEPRWERGNVPWIFRLAVRWGFTMLALLAAAALVRGVDVDGWQALLPAAAIFMVARAILRPLLILLTCPLEILTLGLFTVVINALVFAFTAWISGKLSIGFHVDGFVAALLGSLVVSGVYFIAAGVLRRRLMRGRFLSA